LWGVRVPVAKLLQPWLGVDAIWWSFPISSICAMVMSMAFYRWGNWRQARMLGDEEIVATPAEVGGQPPAPVCNLSTSRSMPVAVRS
ncbi:MAG: MATE family efflux transporter, partial [Comamonas sp.]|nr:MATE family efflux transporter [Candidatus Comamonas equi]